MVARAARRSDVAARRSSSPPHPLAILRQTGFRRRTKPIDEENITELFGPDVQSDYRRKCEAAEAAYEAKRKKELGMLECRELEFLMIDHSSLPPEKAAYIQRKQAEIMKKISKRLICLPSQCGQ
ncbi:hypothetical protein Tco_0978221 [Tanacetum coccineum]|uniref:Uncharacterized protein n=1 Tax=Tanacetum coccineum TaxID=301880 RepID=A0ABQ5EMK5_9ASTR